VLEATEFVATQRLRQRGTRADRYEGLGADFHARVREGFRAIAQGEPGRCLDVDASGDVAAVHAAILAGLSQRVGF
jgi:dTMP kinase